MEKKLIFCVLGMIMLFGAAMCLRTINNPVASTQPVSSPVQTAATPEPLPPPPGDEEAYQPTDERKAQEALPVSKDIVWDTFSKVKITYSNEAPHITAAITPEVKALSGQTLSISGFVLPMDGEAETKHFLLSKRTPTCFYCPPGEPNEVVEVYLNKGISFDDAMHTITGTFALTNNTDNGIFFVLKNAQEVKTKKNDIWQIFNNS
jgi:hypothetical protein